MAIKQVIEIEWTLPPPRCPVCKRHITASGSGQPIAVDENGKIYCRDHGVLIEPDYPKELADYEDWRHRREQALTDLEKDR